MKRDLAFLDLLRIIAALAISCFLHFKDHLIPAFGVEMPFSDNWPITWLASRSATFVELFFVISGLLFALFHLQKIRTGEYSFQRFFQKRALRLYPMVIVTTLYIYVVQNVLYWGTGETWSVSGTVKLWPALRAMLSCGWPAGGPNGPAWYTSVLLICTLLAFPLAKLYDRFRFAFVIPVVIGAICPYDPGGTFKCARGLAGFFVGVGLGILMQRLEEASQDRTGQDRTGQDRTGQDRTGQDRTGQDLLYLHCDIRLFGDPGLFQGSLSGRSGGRLAYVRFVPALAAGDRRGLSLSWAGAAV